MRRSALLVVTSSIAGLFIVASSLFLLWNPGIRAPISLVTGLRSTLPPVDNQDHLYVLDGWGGVHPIGRSPVLSTSASWPDKDIAYSLALFPDGTGGYVMDGWGQLHPVGVAPAVDSNVFWPGWIGAREIVMAPWSSRTDPAGYLLDANGGIHPFGGAPAVAGDATWPGQGTARGIVLTQSSTPHEVTGYTLDGFGGVHPFGGARPVAGAAHWSTDVARGLVLTDIHNGIFVSGYTLDYAGGIHPFGGAPAVRPSATWPGEDVADSLVGWTMAPAGAPGGWVLDRHGELHAWGSAPTLAPSRTWPAWDIARALAGAGSGGGSTERTILEPQPLSDGWGNYFNQRDSRWAVDGIGVTSLTVWRIGCLLTDLAMVYSHFGFSAVTPGTIVAHNGWFNGSGAIFNSALRVPGHTTWIVESPDPSWIRAQVAAGHPVVVGMNLRASTHFVTLTGLDGASDFWTNDPWEQNAMHVTFSGDWFDRGPIYEAIVFI
jgi:hypothetical protein